jgi:hypothetical protein
MRQPLPSSATRLRVGPSWRLLAVALSLVAATPNMACAAANVSAGQAEAKEVAKSQGNCTPAKVDVMRYAPGREGNTVFKVGCSEDKDAFVLVQCRSRICALLR